MTDPRDGEATAWQQAWNLTLDIDRVFDDGDQLLVNVNDMCDSLIKAGWRPPPSGDAGDIAERAAKVIYSMGGYCGQCDYDGWGTCTDCQRCTMVYARGLLAEGLLRAPVGQDEPPACLALDVAGLQQALWQQDIRRALGEVKDA